MMFPLPSGRPLIWGRFFGVPINTKSINTLPPGLGVVVYAQNTENYTQNTQNTEKTLKKH